MFVPNLIGLHLREQKRITRTDCAMKPREENEGERREENPFDTGHSTESGKSSASTLTDLVSAVYAICDKDFRDDALRESPFRCVCMNSFENRF